MYNEGSQAIVSKNIVQCTYFLLIFLEQQDSLQHWFYLHKCTSLNSNLFHCNRNSVLRHIDKEQTLSLKEG